MSNDDPIAPSQHDITIVSRAIRLALPMAGSRLIQMLSGFIGMLMLARLGHQVLAASALMTSTMVTIMLMLISTLFSTSVVVGQTWGAGKRDEIGAIIQQGSVLALLLSVPAMIVFWYIADLLLWMGQLPALVRYVHEYFHALEWGVPAFMLLAALQQACYGMSRQRLVITLNFICLLIFVVMAYVLIFGKLGFKMYGVPGLSYAFVIQAWLNLLLLVLSFYFIRDFKPLQIFSKRNYKDWYYLRQLFHIGWPMSAQFGGELMSFFVVSIMVGWLGSAALAAAQITQQVVFLCVVPMFAIAEATGILVSHSVGAKQYHEIKHIWQVCIGFTLLVTIGLGLIFILFPKWLTSFYVDIHIPVNADVVHLTVWLFVILAFVLIFDSVRNVASGALRGLYDTRFAMITGIVVTWVVGLPIGYALAFPGHLSVIGFRLARAFAMLIGAVLVVWWWYRRLKKL